MSRRSQSPMMRRAGDCESRSTSTTRVSYDSLPGSFSWRDGRDDLESVRGGGASEIANDKITKFDELLGRIEAERKRIATPETTPPRLSAIATPRRSDMAYSGSYDFASRAWELRMSDGVPARTGTPKRSEIDRNEKHISHLARDMTPRSVGRSAVHNTSASPMKSRNSMDGMSSYTPAQRRSESLSVRHVLPRSAGNTPVRSASPAKRSFFSKPASSSQTDCIDVSSYMPTQRRSESPTERHVPPWSAGNNLVRSASPAVRSSSSKPASANQTDFNVQVENFHRSLVSAHDTISMLEKDAHSLKKKVEEKDDCISSLEHRNKSLNETIAKRQDSVLTIETERNTLLSEKSATSTRHAEELEKLRRECDGYRRVAGENCKVSTERDANVDHGAKNKLGYGIQEKDKMIGSLRNEIQRLNEELADGSFVRSQALKAEKAAKKFEDELEKCKADHASATKVIIDLEVRLKEKTEGFGRDIEVKNIEIATLKSKLLSGSSMRQESERMKEKIARLESHLDDSKLLNEKLLEKMTGVDERLERSEREARTREEDVKRLESSALESESREKDLKRRLVNEERELERQRERFEKYDADCAMEQETVAALEIAIESLETAHNDGNNEIIRLQTENRRLSDTLTEAEDFMKMYQQDMKDSENLKSMVNELERINADLDQQLQNKQDQIRTLHDRIASIEMQVESSSASSQQAILQLENLAAQREDDIQRLVSELSSKCDSQGQVEVTSKKLVELTTLFEESEAELEQLRMNKSKLLSTISKLELELEDLKKKEADNENQREQFRKQAIMSSARVSELEESLEVLQNKLYAAEERLDDGLQLGELNSELQLLRGKLADRDAQLADSRKSIAEAQKMIFRLMNTVQDLRTKAKEKDQCLHITSE